jgi:hypothetical protein
MACFWEHLHKELGTNLVRSSAYHPQTAGQTERVNQIFGRYVAHLCHLFNGFMGKVTTFS